MNINQQFTAQISRVEADGETIVAPALAAAITSWTREFNEEEEIEDDDSDNSGFLVPEDGTEDEDEEMGDGDEGAEDEAEPEDEADEEQPNSVLYLTATANKAVLADLRELQENADADETLMIRFTYGNDEIGKITREFEVSPDLFVNLTGGEKSEGDLIVQIEFDAYTGALHF